jgi:hypothetical protein
VNDDVVLSLRNEVALGVVAELVEETDKGADKEKVVSGVVELASGVVAELVEEADKGAARDTVAEVVIEYGEESYVEKGKSEYIHRSVWSGKAPTVRGFYSERAAAAFAKHQQQNSVQSKHLKKVSPKKTKESSTRKRCRSRSSSSSSSSSSNASS